MSLVELLVVVAILGLLAVTVVPTLATTAESTRTREAARTISTFIAQSQARAIGRPDWSGFVILASNAASAAAVDLVFAEVPDIYRGDTDNATVSVASAGGPTRALSFSGASLGLALINIQTGDLIRFGGTGPWYELHGHTAIRLRTHSNAGDYSEDAGQTARNTPWPTAGIGHTFEILRNPEPSGSPSSIPNGRVIDLYWSGFGPDGAASTFQTGTTRFFANLSPPQYRPVAVLFDAAGRLRRVVAPGVDANGSVINVRKTITGPVFLLIGRADRAGETNPNSFNPADDKTGCNWQYADSYWICIDPISGIVRTAGCTPGATTVVQSQTWIRQSLLESGG